MNVFVNEFHYDNDGADAGEFIEIAGPAGTDLTGWSLVLYNGNNNQAYKTLTLSGVLADAGEGYGFLAVDAPGLQNGAPDGFALVNAAGEVVEFLSYEGEMTAADGPANGMTSTDVGVSESGSTPEGFSIQRTGTGSEAGDFAFAAPGAETRGAANTGQSFATSSFNLQITEIWPGNEPGSNLTDDWFEVTNAGTAAWVAAEHGALWFDDDSQDPADAVKLGGIERIEPGESVVFVEAADADGFRAIWEPVTDLGQIGTHDGKGLGKGGDGVTLFLDADGDGAEADEIIDFETYPDASGAAGASWDVEAGAFSTDAGAGDGVVTTKAVNDQGQPATGSPTNGEEVTPVEPVADFTLELFHLADQEGASNAIVDAPNLSAVLNALRAEDLGDDGLADNSLTLSSGDAIIPGVFFAASKAAFGAAGVGDFQIQNELGIQAIAFGNHEFDTGPGPLAGLISGTIGGSFNSPFFTGTALEGANYVGANFPYLSTTLDYSADVDNLAPLVVDGGQSPQAATVTSSVKIDVNGEEIGVIGATTPTLGAISSPGDVAANPQPFDGNPTPEQLDALAAEIQTEVDALLAANPSMNKVILLAHMQRIDIELALAERLSGVDIIVAGGSNTRLFDDNDHIRDGDSDQGQYPAFRTDVDGNTVAVVNTDGSYKYLGRLVIDFDADGHIIAESYDETVSGAYATDAEGVAALGAEGMADPEIEAIAKAIEAEIIATESNVFGVSDVFLNGARSGDATDPADTDGVRSQETNLGDLTADANLHAAKLLDETVVVSIKNGGGIRASIGEVEVEAGSTEAVRKPNRELTDSSGEVIKPQGGISENDIKTALAFNNDLVLLTLTGEEIVALLEHGVSALPGVVGAFPQISGLKFSFDPDNEAGARIVNAGIFGEDGEEIARLVEGGELVNATQEFRVVTLGFLARPRFDEDGNFTGGGDGYPFPNTNTDPEAGEVGENAARVNITRLHEEGVQTGDAVFADNGTEQDALAEYLDDRFASAEAAFSMEDTGRDEDSRIQNLNFRTDAVFGEMVATISVVISEIMYNPASTEDTWEWVEITNTGTEAISLAGWVIDDGNNSFHSEANIAGGMIGAGESAVLFNGDDVSAEDFAAAWGDGLNLVAVTGWSVMALNNAGDTVSIWSSFADYDGDQTSYANAVASVAYDDSGAWPSDDGSASIYLTDLSADANDGANWALSAEGVATPAGEGRAGGENGGDIGSPGGEATTPNDVPEAANVLNISDLGALDVPGSEIADYDPLSGRGFVTSGDGLQVLTGASAAASVETLLDPMDNGANSSAVTSVSVGKGIVAIAVPDATITDNGSVFFYSAADLGFLGSVNVGPLPDMLTFSKDGAYLLVANEGQSAGSENEPNVLPNPAGSVSVIAVNAADIAASTVTTVGFEGIDAAALVAKGVRINPNAPSAAADIEPEYIAIEGDKAYITLQENNAVAVLQSISAPTDFTIDDILPLGLKDHSVIGQGLDASNKDDGINIAEYDIKGMYMPDAIATYQIGGKTYFVTANEGDGRDVDESRGRDLVDGNLSNGEVDADIGDELRAQLADEALLGRLKFSNVDGDTDGDGDIDVLHSFGARSFSIFDEDGNLVFDSGDDFEQITSALVPEKFNSNGDAGSFDSRSDDKGPEPEGVTIGEIDGQSYAFIGLERVGGVMVWNVTDPENPVFDQYIDIEGDTGPEGLKFISAEDSPTGAAVLVITNEVSETTRFLEIKGEEKEITLISAIQGSSANVTKVTEDDVSAMEGQLVTIRAVVTADFQSGENGVIGSDLSGFFVQEEEADYDDDAFTSEGLFIFDDFATGNPDVKVGDIVEVTGTVQEYFGQTQLSASDVRVVGQGVVPAATTVTLGETGAIQDASGGWVTNLEAYEGMLVNFASAMTITEMFNLDRFGEYRVSSDGRQEQFTQNNAPDADAYAAHVKDTAANTLVLDDGRTDQNPDMLEVIDGNDGQLGADDSFRMGDQINNLTGVVAYGFNEFRLHDAQGDYSQQNQRPEVPEDVGGDFKVATLNVLNFFTTLDQGGARTDTGLEPRGADSQEEYDRQLAKSVEAIVSMDADVLGLLEIENTSDNRAVAALVEAVNAALGSDVYDYVRTGIIGGDAIANALIYKTGSVSLAGDAAILEAFEGRDFIDPLDAGRPLNRPSLAQSFTDLESGESFTVAVNHLKSKGSLSGLAADEDQGDGQGNNNATRTEAAKILADWLDSDPTGQDTGSTIIMGDLNSYGREDPIRALAEAGYIDLARAELGEDAYSYVFDGQIGTLDYLLAKGEIAEAVTGVTEWHINADEADAFDYNLDFGRDASLFDGESPARNSDHDPVIAGFAFEADEPLLITGTEGRDILNGTEADEIIAGLGGRQDVISGGGGADLFVFGAEISNGKRDYTVITDFGDDDLLDLGGAEITREVNTPAQTLLFVGEDNDIIALKGVTDFNEDQQLLLLG